MKRNLSIIFISAVLVVIFALLLFVFQVRQSEVVILTTFEKPTAQPYDRPGAYFKWPWPIQKVHKFDQRIQNFEDKFTQTLTADNNNLIVTIYTGWKISDAKAFYPKFQSSVPAAQRILDGMLRSAQNAVIGKHNLSDFVNADPKELKFDAIEDEIKQIVQSELSTNDYGIRLEFLGFKKIELPESVTQTVFDRMKNERQKLISKTENEGKAEAQKIASAADRQAAETIANADAAATSIRGEGEAAAAKVLPVFQQNPALANYLLRIDALKQSLNQRATLIFDERTPPFDLFLNFPTNTSSR